MWNVSARTSLIHSGMALVVFMGAYFVNLSKAKADGPTCAQLFEPSVFRQKPDRLYDYYSKQIELLSNEEVQSLNRSFVETMQGYVPPANTHRAQAIDTARAQRMLDIVLDHPTIGLRNDDVYMRPNEEMGFCFGRAMYLHLLALKLGVQKESIKKIWAVGPMESDSPGISWGYHVGLLIFSKEGWIVLDPNMGRWYRIHEWIDTFSKKSQDGRIRFYATEPDKFGLYSGKYSRYILGSDLTITEDWFRHYFVDMIAATRTESLQSLGMTKMTATEGKISKSFTEMLKGFFGL